MESAAKRRNSSALGVIALAIAFVAPCLLGSAATASSIEPSWSTTAPNNVDVGPKTRAEVFGPFKANLIAIRHESPVNSSSNYDANWEDAIECTVAPNRTAATLTERLEAIAARRLSEIQADAGYTSHFFSRHGAHTTVEQQYDRALTGLTPDGFSGNIVDSGRFSKSSSAVECCSSRTGNLRTHG